MKLYRVEFKGAAWRYHYVWAEGFDAAAQIATKYCEEHKEVVKFDSDNSLVVEDKPIEAKEVTVITDEILR